MGERLDYPNKQVLGLDPPWIEGTGGGGEAPQPQAEAQAATGDDLDEMSKADLLDMARSMGIVPANEAMTKAELTDGIRAARGK